MATPTTHCYQTHFYCAICGGPFSAVYRTAEKPARPSNFEKGDPERMSVDLDEEKLPKELDPKNEYNIPPERNHIISKELIDADIGTGAAYVKSLRLLAEASGQRKGYATEPRAVRHAYDGKLISVEEMEWTKNLRALIHKKAKKQPQGSPFEVGPDQNPLDHEAYFSSNTCLTGRGQIRKHYSWADAYPDIDAEEAEEEEEREPEALFSKRQIRQGIFGFNVYQELHNKPLRAVLGSTSIPFHDDCWSLLNLAIEVAMTDRGVTITTAPSTNPTEPTMEPEDEEDLFSNDELWDTLVQLIGEASNEKTHFNFPALLQEDPSQRVEVVTKLGLVDYRHSESCNEGWKWRHEEGLHWVVAEPSSQATLVRRENDISHTPSPTVSGKNAPRDYDPSDPFRRVPKELIHMIFRYMSSTDVYSLRAASRRVHDCYLPPETYRRFLATEFKYVPLLQVELEQTTVTADDARVDYKGTFEWIRRSMRTPRPSTSLLNKCEPGREWDEIDIGLKNRHRIWKIVCPIAESFAETSSKVLFSRHRQPQQYQHIYEAYSNPLADDVAKSIHVLRGYFGRISGGEGHMESAYFGWEELRIMKIRIFLTSDKDDAVVCGIRFYGALQRDPQPFRREIRPGVVLKEDRYPKLRYRFGRMGPVKREFPPGTGDDERYYFTLKQKFRGFDVRYKDGIIAAFRPIIENYETTAWCGPSHGGVVRNMTVRQVDRFVGVAGFTNSGGFIETFGLMEKGTASASASETIKRPSDPEFSAWLHQPPPNLSFNSRVGVKLYNWRTAPCEWEIWDHRHLSTEAQNSRIFLSKIRGYMDGNFLRGLEFTYLNNSEGTEVVRLLGSNSNEWITKELEIGVREGERVLGAVIAESSEGIHSLLLATNKNSRSLSFGPPYHGAHRVFVEATKDATAQRKHRYTNIYRLNPPIIGLHCIYDHRAKRFLQLGLIESNNEGVVIPPVTMPYSIYSESDGLATWVDSPLPTPPSITGGRVFEIGCRDLRTNLGDCNARFSAWIDFENLEKVEFYGEMAGVKFTYKSDRPDPVIKSFGDTRARLWDRKKTLRIGDGERIGAVGVQRKDQKGTLLRTATGTSGSFNPKSEYFPVLAINPSDLKNCTAIIESRFLTGIKFLFSAQRITYWVPLFSDNPNDPRDILGQDLLHTYKCPWRQYHDLEHPIERGDGGTPSERSGYIITRYGNGKYKAIDRVRAYITLAGNFSGLVFSRNDVWDTDVFGVPTGIEITLKLQRGEHFESLWVSYQDSPNMNYNLDPNGPYAEGFKRLPSRPVVAIALATNKGRVTPWFGKPHTQNVVCKLPPQGHRMVGLTGELKTNSDPMWKDIHILQRLETSATPVLPPISPSSELHFGAKPDHSTLRPEWLHNPVTLPNDFVVMELQRKDDWKGDAVSYKGLTYTIFNPEQLQFISVYSKKPSTNYGILGIGLEGVGKMGAVLVGSVPDESEIDEGRVGSMAIDSARGERIIHVNFAYGLGLEEDNIMALEFITNRGNKLSHIAKGVNFDLLALQKEQDASRNPEEHKFRHMACPASHEIVGFLGLVRTKARNIHDLALITRPLPVTQPEALASASSTAAPATATKRRAQPMDELTKRYSERGWTQRATGGSGSRSKRALSGAGPFGGAAAGGNGNGNGNRNANGDEMNLRSRKVARKE